ncbi:complex I 24 kDa subunit family protein [Sporomusa acidovorans]|uniref:NADP-reducing hydrogenase subunit HndA n=1 Tax=Sporomusa acidovorans (strain ATCC 49682 / DSM 3132 / Mol) TaxID=1123286 RepID=A0ABZ3J0J9_SPOA4|nr:NAD(P)H-dependent oxidoreductase subunit E [Sporomusa acidovorans]OZC22451.1 NADP-reducing hydrogenase subunit HndA [Sporomusa acidovorans DSM 3132]SDE74550.1 NADH-quinone oxidoreductase subunit E [Sporomusa acidovorans]
MCCSKVTKDQALRIVKQYEQVMGIINKYDKQKEQLLSILLDIQCASGENYVAEEWAEVVARELELPISKVHDVLTFYAMFNIEPKGKYVIEICKSTPCHVTKADAVVKMFEEELGIKLGQTTPDNLFTLLHTSCVGACDIGPVAKIGDDVYGNLTADKVAEIVTSYRGVSSCQK